MNVVIISTFDTFFDRVQLLRSYYETKGYKVTVITSNFSHRLKEIYVNEEADVQLSVLPYKKNLSVARMCSHAQFAKKTRVFLEKHQPDLVHCIIPCNSLCKELSKYKYTHRVQLIFDVNDLWPESLPVGSIKNVFPFTCWRNLRERYIEKADYILTECDYFQSILKKEMDSKWTTLHYSKKQELLPMSVSLNMSSFHFCYLGSINNIIDIDLIALFLKKCSLYKPVTLHIIGGGEKKEELISSCSSFVEIMNHGYIFDLQEKQAIFDQCHYGLNVMKPSVIVGLTMKSLDYMWGGLPLINTIQGDTKKLCELHDVGYTITRDSLDLIVSTLEKETLKDNLKKRESIRSLYVDYFTQCAFNKTLEGLNLV